MGDKVGTVYESILPGRFTEQNSQGPDVKFQSARKVGSSTCCRTLLKCFVLNCISRHAIEQNIVFVSKWLCSNTLKLHLLLITF